MGYLVFPHNITALQFNASDVSLWEIHIAELLLLIAKCNEGKEMFIDALNTFYYGYMALDRW